MKPAPHSDVVILGAGLAGLSLARQLLRESDRKILVIDRQEALPPERQKVGEATVQVSGYYFSKVLDLEEHLFREHYMKYNLRFYWKSAGRDNRSYEDYSQAYIRNFSNLASYQLDRNKLEAELLALNRGSARFTLLHPVDKLQVDLAEEGPHTLRCEHLGEVVSVTADWVVDTTGRGRFLAKRLGLGRQTPIRHGAYFLWVDGLVNVERLSGRPPRAVRLARERSAIGHLPVWLATNHFMGEGYWFWVIPLQGKTSLGLVFDPRRVPREEVSSPEKLIAWIGREFPLFGRDLPQRRVLHFAGFKDFAHDCSQTIHPARWALSGEAGRFSDPLYSPGGDLIAIHNTLIKEAILSPDSAELKAKAAAYDQLMRAVYDAYVPSYAVSYDVLGDPEAYTLKYGWELTVYFGLYVFPFINDLFTDRRFILSFLRTFSRLGPINRALQQLLSDYYRWKKVHRLPPAEPAFFDFMDLGPLRRAERTFYQVGLTVDEARPVLAEQLANLEELARFLYAHVASVVVDDERLLTNRDFIDGIDLADLTFDAEGIGRRYAAVRDCGELHRWSFDPFVLAPLRSGARTEELVP